MAKNETVAVVVTYNRSSMLKECIGYLSAQTTACDIMIIDNASTDDTAEMLKPMVEAGKLLYENTGKNLGGAGGFNYGMKKAVQMGYEYIWIMDDDTFPDETALEELMHADRKLEGRYGFLSSVAYWKDGSICNMNRQRSSFSKVIENFDRELIPAVMATFVSFFVKREMILEMGLPISEFFIWSDDLEYSRRISLKYPCYVVSKSRVLHNMASNNKVGIHQESKDRLWRYSYLYRNERYVFRREGIPGMAYYWLRVNLHKSRVRKAGGPDMQEKLDVINDSVKAGKTFRPKVEFVSLKEETK